LVVRVPGKPAERRALAGLLVARFAKLTRADKDRLLALGDDAFPPLLKAYLNTCYIYDAEKRGDSFPLYEKFHNIGDCLIKVTSRKRAADLMHTLDNVPANSSSKPLILSLLGEYGDPKPATPYFLREIKGASPLPSFEMYESVSWVSRDYVIHSTDPRAVALAMSWLKNPKANSQLRFESYVHLAGTGGEAGLRAVLAERHPRKLLRPLVERVENGYLNAGEFGSRTEVVAQRTDSKGRTYGLLRCGILGNAGDLWVAERAKGKWKDPLFAGVSDEPSRLMRTRKPPAPSTYKGLSAKQLVGGAWFGIVDDPDLSRDSTHCGLTDIEKKRLCLDLDKADTDADGDLDGVDPAPNAARRPLSDAEQVLATVFEARYHYDSGEGPALFRPAEGMQPFELLGRRGPTIWGSAKRDDPRFKPLVDCWERGVAFIGFGPPNMETVGATIAKRGIGRGIAAPDPKAKRWEDRIIGWNHDHTEAAVMISTSYGGLNGTGYYAVVRKFGLQWVVITMDMAYIS
jgi:hypothetical protein